MLEYLVFRLLSLLAPRVPPAVAYPLIGWIGDATYRLLPRRRANVLRNLSTILRDSPDELPSLAREVFREGAKYYYDTFRIPALSDEDLERSISLEGWGNLERGLAAGRGVVMVSAHLGSPMLVAQILAARRCRVTAVVEAVEPPGLLDLMTEIRSSRGIRVVPFGPDIVRQLSEALNRNEIVGLVADRDLQKNGIPVEMFGSMTTLPSGPVMLAMRSGASLIPGFTYRLADGRFSAQIGEALELVRTGRLKDDLRTNTQRLAKVMERAIATKPGQWIVFEPVWPQEADTGRPGDLQ